MTKTRNKSVSEIVEKYRETYPQAERRVLKSAILKKHPHFNVRTLDRHLKKAFKKSVEQKLSAEKADTGVSNGWVPLPNFRFSPVFEEVFLRNRPPDEAQEVQFPSVAFHWYNYSCYQLIVRLEVRVFLGYKFLGLIDDIKGYYNGKARIIVDPTSGLKDGVFTLPVVCKESELETTIEVKARILDRNDMRKSEYTIINSWTYTPQKKNWFFEPKSFSDEIAENLSSNDGKTSEDNLIIKQALESLRTDFLFLREPTVSEVSFKCNVDPDIVKSFFLTNGLEIKDPKKCKEVYLQVACDIINFAGLICWKETNEKNPLADLWFNRAITDFKPELFKKARKIATGHSALVPHIKAIEKPEKFDSKLPVSKKIARFPNDNLLVFEWSSELNEKYLQIFSVLPSMAQYWQETRAKGLVET